ncbi:MAG: RHS repeat-associated core domain-containing protein [Acidimicrobiales bacterium]
MKYDGYKVITNSSDQLCTGLDSGTIMILNTSGQTEMISNLSVVIGSYSFSGWATQTLDSGQGALFDQTSAQTSDGLDMSNTPANGSCTYNPTVPRISYTVQIGNNSVNVTKYDSGQVLTSGGIDYGTPPGCPGSSGNEEQSWTPLGQRAAAPPNGGAPGFPENVGNCGSLERGITKVQHNVHAKHGKEPVNTENGDMSLGYSGFSDPAIGHPLDFNLTYDSFLAQVEAANNAPGPFGYGWTDSGMQSLGLSSSSGTTTAQATCGAGAGASFIQAGSNGTCPSATNGSLQPSSPVGHALTSFCALPRVTARLQSDPGSTGYTLTENSGHALTGFASTGQVVSFGTPNDPSFVTVTYDVQDFTGKCQPTSPSVGNCTVYTDASGQSIAIENFLSSNAAMGVLDVNGKLWSLSYNNSSTIKYGNLATITNPLNQITSFTYSSSNSSPYNQELVTETSPLGYSGSTPNCGTASAPTYTTCYTYTTSGATSGTLPACGTYGTFYLMPGNTSVYAGQVTQVTDPLGNTTKFAYCGKPDTAAGGSTLITDPLGNQELDTYSYGEWTSKTTGYGTSQAATTNYVYDPNTLMRVETINPMGNATTDAYNSAGKICWSAPGAYFSDVPLVTPASCSSISPSPPPGATIYTYNASGQLVATTDPRGSTQTQAYDASGKTLGTVPVAPNSAMLGLSASACPSSSQCYLGEKVVATKGSAIYSTSNGGGTWTPDSTPANVASVTSIVCFSVSTCLATDVASNSNVTTTGATFPVILSTTNSGATWSAQSISDVTALDSLSCPTTSQCYAAGDSNSGAGVIEVGSLSGTTWTWSSASSPSGVAVATLSSISCSTSTNCVAVGAGTNGAFDPIDVFTTDGSNWSSQDQGAVSQLGTLQSIDCVSTTSCLVVGGDTQNNSDIVAAAWSTANSNWSFTSLISYIPNITTEEPAASVSCPSATSCFVSGTTNTGTGYVLSSSTAFSNTNWTYDQVPSTTASLDQISCSTTSNCTAVGNSIGGTPDAVVTSDGGAGWSGVTALPGLSSMSYYTNGCVPVAGTNNCTGGNLIGQLASTTDANGNTTTYTSDSQGNTTSSTDPYGNKTTYSYDASGNLIETVSPKGNVSGATQQNFATFNAYNAVSELCWSAKDEPSTFSNPTCSSPPSNATIYTYDANGNRTNTQSPPGPNTTAYTSNAYNAHGQLCWSAPSDIAAPSCSSPPSNATIYTYDANGNEVKLVNPDGNTTTWKYTDPAYPNAVVSRVLPSYSSSSQDLYSYNADGQKISHTDPMGNVTTYGYDSRGLLVGKFPGVPGGVSSLGSISCPSTSNCVAGGTTTTDSAVTLSTSNSGSGFSVGTGFSSLQDLTSLSCPSTSVCFGVASTTSTSSAGVFTSSNGGESWSSETLPSGVGTLTSISCATTTNCVATGTGSSQIDPIAIYTTDGVNWSLQDLTAVSQLEELLSVTCVTTSSCVAVGGDTSGNADIVTATWSTSSNTWNWTSQIGGVPNLGTLEPLTSVSCSGSNCVATGGTTSSTGAILSNTTSGFGSWNTDALPGSVGPLSGASCPTSTECSVVGETSTAGVPAILSTTTLSNSSPTWSAQSAPVNTDPSTNTSDPAMNASLSAISCDTSTTCYASGTSDAGAGTVIMTTNSGATWSSVPALSPQTFAHDPNGNQTQMTDSTGVTTYAYDAQNRVISVQDRLNDGTTTTTSYGYDNNSNVVCIAYQGVAGTPCTSLNTSTNEVVNYQYDHDNRMVSMTDWLSGANTTTFSYDQNSNVTSVNYPSSTSLSMSMAYDPSNSLTNVNFNYDPDHDGDGSAADTDSDGDGTLTEALGRAPNQAISSFTQNSSSTLPYTYSGMNQVTEGTGSSYSYSPGGELTCTTAPNSTSSSCPTALSSTYSQGLFYGQGNTHGPELCAQVPGTTTYNNYCSNGGQVTGETSYQYNQDSNRTGSTYYGATSNKNSTYSYDASSNLTCITVPNTSGSTCSNPTTSSSTTYSYNADNLRMTQSQPGGTTSNFTWNTVSSSIPRILSNGTTQFLYGPNLFGYGAVPIEQITGNTQSYLASDPAGVRGVLNSTGTLTTVQSYSPYGIDTVAGTPGTTPFGFQGAYLDPGGLLYMVNREYDPSSAQFLQVDPALNLTAQVYNFANGDPVNGSDPLGLLCLDALDPFSSGFGQCWSSGYETAYHHPQKVIPIALLIVVSTLCIGVGGWPCLVAIGLSGAYPVYKDIVRGCSWQRTATDAAIAALALGLGGIANYGETALEDSNSLKYVYRVHETAAGSAPSILPSCC